MTSEFDLRCATCGGPLQEATVSAATLGLEAAATLSVAECASCGGRYVPEGTLDRIGGLRGE